MSGEPVTIDDVARAAGVHPATVSRALRGVSGKVSPETRAEIERIARYLGYQPNFIAASLRTKQTNMAAIIVPDLNNPVFGPIVQGLELALRQHEILCLVVQTPASADERHALIVALANRQASGLLILAAEGGDPMLEAAKSRKLPVVLINRGSGEREYPSVVNDDRESVHLVLEHLVSLGHRSIAHLAGPLSSSTGLARRAAFADILRSMGLTQCPVVEAPAFTRAAGREATEKLLQSKGWPTAIFGALDVLNGRKINVPRDMSLVGHNDMPLVDLINPPLTTVRVAVEQMSEHAAALFLETLRHPELAPSTRVLMPSLVVRKSTSAV